MLRRLLGERLHIPPQHLVFEASYYGKPRLTNATAPIGFNLSHSGDRAAIAITSGAPVGIDIEQIRPLDDWAAITARFFSQRENQWLHALPLAEQLTGFYRLWTLKEAVLKADGRGLSFPLSEIEITITPAGPLLNTGEWILSELNLAAGYTAAIAAPNVAP
jgi:4'-phosphopantetheinyl transferase